MKNKFRNRLITGLMLILASAFIIPVSATAFQYGGEKHFKASHKRMNRFGLCLNIWRNPQIIKDLNLSNEQVEKIKRADFNMKEQNLTLRTKMDQLRLKMDRAYANDRTNDEKIMAIAKKIAKTREQNYLLSIESRLKLKKILTPEQIKKLESYIMTRRIGHMGRGRNMMPKRF